MRILFVIHSPKDPLTAVFHNTNGRAKYLNEHGHNVSILAPEDFPKLKRLPHRLLPLFFPFAVAYWIARRAEGIDLVNFHSYAGWIFNLLRYLLPSRKRLRTIIFFHGLEPIYYSRLKNEKARNGEPLSLRYRLIHGTIMPRLLRWSCHLSDLVMCLNSAEASYLVRNRWCTTAKVVIVPNCASSEFLIERQWDHRARRLLFIGQWLDMKGTRYLVEAFTRLARRNPDLSLWCVGTLSNETIVLEDFPEDVRELVRVMPRVDRKRLLELCSGADIFVFPSLSEGFSLALLEAMSTGLPIITTDVGAAPDLLGHEISALFVPVCDAPAISDAVQRLLSDDALRKVLGTRAQARAEHYTCESVYLNYMHILDDFQHDGVGLDQFSKTMVRFG
jgi:glycosyltransferase involved in cell wall biosynthesis